MAVSGLSCGMRDLSFLCVGFLLVVVCGFFLSSCGAQAPGHVGSVVCSMQALAEACKLSSCGVQDLLPRGMWDLSSPTRDRTCVPCVGRWILYHWTSREVPGIVFFFFLLFIIIFLNLFIYLFMAALGLHCCARAFSSCGEWGLLFIAVRGLLIVVASLVAEHGL